MCVISGGGELGKGIDRLTHLVLFMTVPLNLVAGKLAGFFPRGEIGHALCAPQDCAIQRQDSSSQDELCALESAYGKHVPNITA